AGAETLYRKAIKRDPAGWYALLARQRLGEKAPPFRLEATPLAGGVKKKAKHPAPIAARLARAEGLYAAGMIEEGGLELDAAIAGRRDAGLLATAAELARGAGDHHRAWQLGLFRLGGLRGAADLAYPEAVDEEVRAAAPRFAVDPHFVWSI